LDIKDKESLMYANFLLTKERDAAIKAHADLQNQLSIWTEEFESVCKLQAAKLSCCKEELTRCQSDLARATSENHTAKNALTAELDDLRRSLDLMAEHNLCLVKSRREVETRLAESELDNTEKEKRIRDLTFELDNSRGNAKDLSVLTEEHTNVKSWERTCLEEYKHNNLRNENITKALTDLNKEMKTVVDAQQQEIEVLLAVFAARIEIMQQGNMEKEMCIKELMFELDTLRENSHLVTRTAISERQKANEQLKSLRQRLDLMGEHNYSLVKSLEEANYSLVKSLEEAETKKASEQNKPKNELTYILPPPSSVSDESEPPDETLFIVKKEQNKVVRAAKPGQDCQNKAAAKDLAARAVDPYSELRSCKITSHATGVKTPKSGEGQGRGGDDNLSDVSTQQTNDLGQDDSEKNLWAELDDSRQQIQLMFKEKEALSVFLDEAEESIKELKKENKRNKDCITKLSAELHALHQNMDSVCKEKESLGRSLRDADKSFDVLREKAAADEELIQELTAANTRNDDCITKLTAELHALHQNLDSVCKEKESLVRSLHDADHSFDVLREKAAISLHEAGTRYESSRNENLEKDEYIKELRAEAQELREKLELTIYQGNFLTEAIMRSVTSLLLFHEKSERNILEKVNFIKALSAEVVATREELRLMTEEKEYLVRLCALRK
jgi:chromosome segregation ATPase